MKKSSLTLTIMTMVITSVAAGPSDSIRCKGRLIQAGDSRLKVKSLCGEPGDVFSINQPVIIHRRYIVRRQQTSSYRFLTEEYQESSTVQNSAQKQALPTTHSHEHIRNHNFNNSPVLVNKTSRITRTESHSSSQSTHEFWECEKRFVNIERYTYNLGPTRFIRKLEFQNAILVNIEFGDYGF